MNVIVIGTLDSSRASRATIEEADHANKSLEGLKGQIGISITI